MSEDNVQVTIPETQVHATQTPALKPFYQEVKITPINNVNEIAISDTVSSSTITFDIPGENVINFYDSYMVYDMDLPTYTIADDDYQLLYHRERPHLPETYHGYPLQGEDQNEMYRPCGARCALRNSFGIHSIRVYNSNGINLFYVDENYSDYIDFMRILTRSQTNEINNDHKYFDGCEVVYDQLLRKNVVSDYINPAAPAEANEEEVFIDDLKWYDRKSRTVKVKLYFRELFNSILSLKSDIRFFEKIKIDIKFNTIRHFAYGYIDMMAIAGDVHNLGEDGELVEYPVHVKIVDPNAKITGLRLRNFCIMACYNQDIACNENTINYICSHEIDINDFHVNSVNITNSASSHVNYQFQINSSYGPYLKFILYRNLNIYGEPYYWAENSNFRWFINDFPWTVDYVRVNPEYESFQKLIKRLKNCYYNNNRREEFVENFFELLDFSNESLINMASRSGRPLDEEVKLTLEANNQTWANLEVNKDLNIGHRFYIVTGRLLKINRQGVEAVI